MRLRQDRAVQAFVDKHADSTRQPHGQYKSKGQISCRNINVVSDISSHHISSGIGYIKNPHNSIYQGGAHSRQCIDASDNNSVDNLLQ